MKKTFLEKCDDAFAYTIVYLCRDFVPAYWKHIFVVLIAAALGTAAYGVYLTLPVVCRMI